MVARGGTAPATGLAKTDRRHPAPQPVPLLGVRLRKRVVESDKRFRVRGA